MFTIQKLSMSEVQSTRIDHNACSIVYTIQGGPKNGATLLYSF